MTTMRDVARVAGVSAKTVSRVFNDDPHVTVETRERVRWAMQKLNYVPNQSYLAPWQERTPTVFVDRAPRKLSGVYVIEDDLSGARQAVAHLASHGHRRVAFLGVSTPVTTTQRRLKGYLSALAENGLDNSADLICMPAESPDEATAELVKRLKAPNGPTAVFSSNIPCTMALVRALQQAERTDVALVGFGDFPMAAALSPAVTVVDQDPARLGHLAVERLLERIEDPLAEPRRRTVLPVRLIPRGSGELRPRP
jgi:LacI family transcriptional regulator